MSRNIKRLATTLLGAVAIATLSFPVAASAATLSTHATHVTPNGCDNQRCEF